ncbi:glycosyltransferase family 4 protein [Flammeovirga aprica]|uniref:Glycosyltransferase family 4 protein n=1 Tax=Flammeovirga aprica JL-4 TaxID=694437 RepID=A0A7X9RUB1_9BACT|nr:glycosyltransferase family 1 protein [Flammeovirga aprica]NME68829.1 glycosyltransferase family 4 protein [Flammeovirga aprica JL-4]
MNIQFLSCLEGKFGIGQYSERLAQGMYRHGLEILLSRKKGAEFPFTNHYHHRSLKNLRNYIAPYYMYKELNNQHRKYSIYHADNIDAFTGYYWSNKKKAGKNIVTIHDVIPLHFKNENPLVHQYYLYQLNTSLKHSDLIVTVSETSKQDLVKMTNVDPSKVEVVYNGIDHDTFYWDKNFKSENDKFTIRYLGGLGVVHKNASALIEVARILEEKGLDFKMEIGSGNPAYTNLPDLVEKYNLKNVSFVGYVADKNLQEFLQTADAFLYPSKFEGFGFPPLEAMACGTATVSSNEGSLGEVLENGALLSSSAPEELAENIIRLMSDENLKKEYEQKGIETAQKYTWSKATKDLANIYENLMR